MVRKRRNVYSLSDTDETLDWYRKAVGALRALPPEDAASWWYMGFCHGVPQGAPSVSGTAGLWNECQHQTWFFLPWHRAYLAGFEAMIAAEVAKQGGPYDWALPYWNYSDAANPQARLLPPAFRDQSMPDGTDNHLWAPRNQPVTLLACDVALGALNQATFSGPAGSVSPGFGGPETGWNHGGGTNGAIEMVPHNVVHGAIGGWMGAVNTAALDPIFWLHHCNIDRLWEVWRGMIAPPRDPQPGPWQSETFRLVGAKGTTFDFQPSQALDTGTLLHGYMYDTVPPVVPSALVAGGAETVQQTTVGMFAAMAEERSSELVAATESPVTLGGGRAESVLRVGSHAEAMQPDAEARAAQRHYLRLENVVAPTAARDYKVFLDLPDDDRLPMQVGVLASFGVGEASAADGRHGGNGLTQVFDVTDAINELAVGTADLGALRVTFEAIERPGLEPVPEATPYAEMLRQPPAELTVGRISLYAE
jgi:tyrosinase